MTEIIKKLKSLEMILLENPDYNTDNYGYIEFKDGTVITDNMIKYFNKEIIVEEIYNYDYPYDYRSFINGEEWHWCGFWFELENGFFNEDDFNI